jgi:hypothetical protein
MFVLVLPLLLCLGTTIKVEVEPYRGPSPSPSEDLKDFGQVRLSINSQKTLLHPTLEHKQHKGVFNMYVFESKQSRTQAWRVLRRSH